MLLRNVAEVDFSNLHRGMTFIGQRLKRCGSDFKHVAVKELQERGAIHGKMKLQGRGFLPYNYGHG